MATYKWKNTITDNIDDAREIIRVLGKSLEEGKIDKAAALDNLFRAMKKLEVARYHIDRD
jgi:hypothetical protein